MKHHVKRTRGQAQKGPEQTGNQPDTSLPTMGNPTPDANKLGKRSKNPNRVQPPAIKHNAGQNPGRLVARQLPLNGLTITLTRQTHVALFKALDHLQAPDGFNSSVNALLQSACEAVMNLDSNMVFLATNPQTRKEYRHRTFCDNHWPPAFTARLETDDEQFARMVLATY